MAKPRAYLSHAPIVEAVVDFRVLRHSAVTADHFSDLTTVIGSEYAAKDWIQAIEARFGLHGGKQMEPMQVSQPLGWRYRAPEAIAQFRIDGFTFSKLEPYTTWDAVFAEASRLWQRYVEIAAPLEVSRIAVRYINRLKLPGPATLGRYLEAPPVLPKPIPQAVREFLTRVVVVDEARRASAILVQALEASLDPAVVPVLLDIDAFREGALSPQDGDIPVYFEQLRQLKNDIFFASITEETVEMYA
jgi:uncharacterized protein (TIGR04255 family)